MSNLQSMNGRFEAERLELESALASGEFGRANNLVRFLNFVCEKYFEGKTEEIKEYSIAVEAFGRPLDFDPQADTIVRVTAHALRKRLDDYYRSGGAQHAVHICLPPGHYIPKFTHKNGGNGVHNGNGLDVGTHQQVVVAAHSNGSALGQMDTPQMLPEYFPASPDVPPDSTRADEPQFFSVRTAMWAVTLLLVCAGLIWGLSRWTRNDRREGALAPPNVTAANALPTTIHPIASGKSFRAQLGTSAAYIDKSGSAWESDQYCSGGTPFTVSNRSIQGTNDSRLFSAGRAGIFHCEFPVAQGTYEVHLFFAETSGLLANSRHVWVNVNGTPAVSNLDVVDDAGGDDAATAQVLTDVQPGKDGKIHLDTTSADSFINAIEILPGTPHQILPVRITTGPLPYQGHNGDLWTPDRYFSGGRVSHSTVELSRFPDAQLYEWHRYGHFHYSVPVATGGTYTLKLHFLEGWFGGPGGALGGVGSRVFDVSCNGNMLLKRFDIFKEAGSDPLVKTFTHIEPTGQGRIEIYFTPRTNYPALSAIEIIPE